MGITLGCRNCMLADFVSRSGGEVQPCCTFWLEQLAADYDEFQVSGVVFLLDFGKMLPSLDYSLSR